MRDFLVFVRRPVLVPRGRLIVLWTICVFSAIDGVLRVSTHLL